jgi:hypothetical protein
MKLEVRSCCAILRGTMRTQCDLFSSLEETCLNTSKLVLKWIFNFLEIASVIVCESALSSRLKNMSFVDNGFLSSMVTLCVTSDVWRKFFKRVFDFSVVVLTSSLSCLTFRLAM